MNLATVQFHELPGNRKAKPQAAMTPRDGGIFLPEPFEYGRQEAGVDSYTVVPDGDFYAWTIPNRHHLNPSSGWCELDSVRQQVEQDLLQTMLVSMNDAVYRLDSFVKNDFLGL